MPKTVEVCNLTAGQSIYRVAREIKKQEHTAFNCLCSIAEDAAFVNEISVLYPDLPLVANLRCGLWYTTNPASTPTCYFKSTDGHQNTLNFSTTRLNWHIAELAAKRGGVLIVDATRKGKRFPDAFSKTIPIWAAVINRAVARVRAHDAQKERRRQSYTGPSGEVLTSVADTQTSISVLHGECSIRHEGTAAAIHHHQKNDAAAACTTYGKVAAHERSQQPQQQVLACQRAEVGCDSSTGVRQMEDVLVDCMADSMELLSGLTVAVRRPGTPELHLNHSSGSQLQNQHASATANGTAGHHWVLGTPIGSPVGRGSSSGLQRCLSLRISSQPSLQEWLDETDVLHRLRAAALHYDGCFSPCSRRPARVSCHSVLGTAVHVLGDAPLVPAAAVSRTGALLASSAPAVSCVLNTRSPRSSCVRAVVDSSEADAGVQLLSEPASPTAPSPGFCLAGDPATEPVTPRLGCCGGLPAAFDEVQATLQQPAASPAVTVPASATARHAHALQHQHTRHGTIAASPSAVRNAADFAFPPAHFLAQSAASAQSGSDCSAVSAAVAGSTCSSCGNGLVAPDMPVVVLNGTSHRPGDAASILDIWRGTDLEDIASLPRVGDFVPGVYHVPERQSSVDEEGHQHFGTEWQQQQLGVSKAAVDSNQEGEVAFKECWDYSPAASACAAAVGPPSSADSSSSWVDEECGFGCHGLCAFAPPPVATTRSAQAEGPGAVSGSGGCLEQQQPGSPSACSTCSTDSRYSQSSHSSKLSHDCHAAAAGSSCAADVPWDTSLHLPLWVPENERQAIEAKLDGFVERLLEVGANVRGLAAQLRKPLRPLWVSQDSLIWTNQVAHPSSLPFTPLLLVSASRPDQCERQAAKGAWHQAARSSGCSGTAAEAEAADAFEDVSDEDVPELTGSMSLGRTHSNKNCSTAARPNKAGRAAARSICNRPDPTVSCCSYVYIPGAGDDEESWACGLTPTLFWDHCSALLSCGPAGLVPAAKQLVQQHRRLGSSSSTTSILVSQQQQGRLRGTGAQLCVTIDQHHLAPKGCVGSVGQVAGIQVVPACPGAFWLGNSGMAMGNLEGATATDIWRSVDAVLCVGSAVPAVLQQEYKAIQVSRALSAAVPATAVLSSSAPAAGSVAEAGLCFKPTYWPGSAERLSNSFSSCSDWARQQQQQQQQQQQRPHQQQASHAAAAATCTGLELLRVDVASVATRPKKTGGMLAALLQKDTCSGQSVGHTPCTAHVDSGSSGSSTESDIHTDSSCSADAEQILLTRVKWLPIESAKRSRVSLKEHLQEALEFVSAHLSAGHLVLLHDPEGHDTCVCLAVATLLACFASNGVSDAAAAARSGVRFVAAWPGAAARCGRQWMAGGPNGPFEVPPQPVTKHSVRQQLAFVSAAYPDARPARGMLKQVFNFFEDKRRAAAAALSTAV